ncbi:MAG: RagB/SusD family nutrient uptake outer membrane protein [Ginsengibacter sp.]
MKKLISLLFATLTVLHLLTGCMKYLDKKSNDAMVVPSTLKDLQGLLDDGFTMNQQTPSLPSSSSDDYFLPEQTASGMPTGYKDIYTWQIKTYNYQNDWSKNYLSVYNANVCLETLATLPRTSSNQLEWDNVKGSALFIRAYCFLNLLWEYAKAYNTTTASADLGIVLRLGSDFNVASKRSSVEECYNQVIRDTKASLDYLPTHPLVVTRPSTAAAYGLLCRTYLTMGMYDSCLKYANATLALNNHLMNFNNDNDINGSLSGPAPFSKFNKETIFYTIMNNTVFLHTYSAGFVDSVLYSMYDSSDLRKNAYFTTYNGYQKFKGTYSGNRNELFTGIASDEIYLDKAESLVRLSKVAEGMDVLNQLLVSRWRESSAFIPLTAASKEEALIAVLTERRKELLLRGLRWIDIKRLNLEGYGIIPERSFGGMDYKLPPNDDRYALPIPTDIINLTGMKQN